MRPKLGFKKLVQLPPVTVTPPPLNPLSLSSTTFLIGTPSSGTISGATTGSTIAGSGLPTGVTINSAARTWAYDGTGSAATGNLTLTETLAGVSNSPNPTVIAYSVFGVGGLATPTLTNQSALGTGPLILKATTTDYVAGGYGQLQLATDSGFASITQNIVFSIDGLSWALGDKSISLITPAGTYYARFRICFDDESSATTVTGNDPNGNAVSFAADVSSWSTTFTDTISASVATLTGGSGTTGAGVNRSKFANVASPFYQIIVNAGPNVIALSRATIATPNAKFHVEATYNAAASTGAHMYFALDDGTTDLTTGPGTPPGGASATNGITARFDNGGTSVTIWENNTATTGTLSVAFAPNDVAVWEIDTTTNICKLYHVPSSTGVAVLAKTITLTTHIPTSWYALLGGANTNDTATFNPGNASWAMTPTSGFNQYG